MGIAESIIMPTTTLTTLKLKTTLAKLVNLAWPECIVFCVDMMQILGMVNPVTIATFVSNQIAKNASFASIWKNMEDREIGEGGASRDKIVHLSRAKK